ncbi:protein kinase [Streptomyces sp. NPDC085946]|uniref:serine/threonine-protein kinase n=1 Tax=Streptomyces sp. NPDC085946 TaxID=3365744 RepID=UPI0037D4405A
MRLRESALALTSRFSAEVLAGRYRLDALIGSGGAADVHRGIDLRLKRPVAVKVFRPGTGIDMEERFQSEAVILARLQHPALVTAYDAGTHNGQAYLVMQLIEGPTLKNRIAEGTLSPEETAALGTDLAQALAHAHEAGIVHRDVKPSNILLDASGRPHLTDFGIARLLDATTHTVTGTLIGTAAYLSPEQVLGRSVGQPSDIYALGLVLLECLTGRLEYDGGPLEAAIARLHRQPVLPSSLPKQLIALLQDMTALDERARPSARDCATALVALTGMASSAPLSSPAHVTSVVSHRTPVRDTNPTHTAPSPAAPSPTAGAVAPKTVPVRRRALVTGGTAVLATVMAVTLGVSDSPPRQGSNESGAQTTSRPSAKADPPSVFQGRNDATPEVPSSSTREISTASSGSPAPNPSTRSTSVSAPASVNPSQEQAVSATADRNAPPRRHSDSDSPLKTPTQGAPATDGQAKTEIPSKHPSKPAKDKKAKKVKANEKAAKGNPAGAH